MEAPTGPFDGYPTDYISHNLPLIVLSGLCPTTSLDQESVSPEVYKGLGCKISSESSIIQGERAELLLQEFFHFSKTDVQWNSKPVQGSSGLLGFRFRAVGRDFILPPRKAEPPSEAHTFEPPSSPSVKSPSQWLLHSPISPLSPCSPTFPDGVMTPVWITKHQQLVPSAFISFFSFSSDPARNSLLDNQLKTEVNGIKAALYRSEYKTRYIVVLLSDKTILEAPEIEDRLANIRRAVSLDARTGFFFLPPNTSRVEVASFVESLLSTLQPICVEYYRDLTKHTRRKKNRGSIPPPTAPPTKGTSQTLAALGWGVRYDFKLGVFAEFRQEMEAACRHYTSALESLIGPDGIFETTASWSPRWDEARLLADTLALRVIRCLLWSHLTSTAAQSWSNYRDRMRELVDRRGKGSSNYGWEAWESRWAKMMGELICRAGLQSFQIQDHPDSKADSDLLSRHGLKIFASVEKAFPVGERLCPWHHLHHPGYWWRQAARHTKVRRHLALQLPEEDRIPPGLSPASAMASRYGTYDTYLCPEPHAEFPVPGKSGYDHSRDILHSLDMTLEHLKGRDQRRLADEVLLEKSKELMQTGQSMLAMHTLHTLWEGMSWRRERWWRLVYEVTQNLCRCAKLVGNVELFAATQYELYSSMLPLARNSTYDLLGAVGSLQRKHTLPQHESKFGPHISLSAGNITSFLSAQLIFLAEEGSAGEPVNAQLTVVSKAHKGSAPISMNQIEVQLEGGASRIDIMHEDEIGQKRDLTSVLHTLSLSENLALKTSAPSYTAKANLTLHAGQIIIFDFPLVIREAGPVAVSSITLSLKTDHFALNYTSEPDDNTDPAVWWIQGPFIPRARRLGREECSKIQILPRPPKMQLRMPGAKRQFYTDEIILLDLEVKNLEDEKTEAAIDVQILSRDGSVEFSWLPSLPIRTQDANTDLPGHYVGDLEVGESKTERFTFAAPFEPSDYVIEVKVLYHLLSDRETLVSRKLSVNLNIVRAFEANYDFSPRVHDDPWPTLFGISSLPSPTDGDADLQNVTGGSLDAQNGKGVVHRWRVAARLVSFADEVLVLRSVDLEVHNISGGATVTTTKETALEVHNIKPQEEMTNSFVLDITKSSLEDRRSTNLDTVLKITWQRQSTADEMSNSIEVAPIISSLPIPPLSIPNSEPRVLCARTSIPLLPPESSSTESPSQTDTLSALSKTNIFSLTYTLENPTTHFLTFDLSMESTDDFAFSGPKLRSLNLLPLSRGVVAYRILPLVATADEAGVWIDIRCRVVDRYFKKVLRVLPASEGIKEGKGGGLSVWVDGKVAI